MPYYASGEGRDSYITGVRPCGKYGVWHDVAKRRDNLPDNMYSMLRDEVEREHRLRNDAEEARARAHQEYFSGHCSKKMAGGTAGDEKRAMKQLEELTRTSERHDALVELYRREMEAWDIPLGERALASLRP